MPDVRIANQGWPMTGVVVSHRPLDLLEPLAGMQGAFACSPGALSSWAMAAAAGRRCVYARAPRLSGAVAERARTLARSGVLLINQPRSPVDATMFDFVATRSTRPIVAEAAAIERLSETAVDVLDLLERAAARRMPCPTNGQIGAALGGMAARKVSQAISTLSDAGFVEVQFVRSGHDGQRTIRILATGETLCAA